jgi:hypothetical protein
LGPFLKRGRDAAAARVDGRPEDASPVVQDPGQSEKTTGVGVGNNSLGHHFVSEPGTSL